MVKNQDGLRRENTTLAPWSTMHVPRTGLAALLFCVSGLALNWPLAGLFLEKALPQAYLSVFGAMGLLVAALALLAHTEDKRDASPEDRQEREE